MPQCQFPVFCYFCVLENLHRKYSRNWTKQKPNLLFTEALRRPKMRRRGARGWPHYRGARPSPWSCPPMVRPPGPLPNDAPSPIKTPRREKPKGRIAFPRNILQAAAAIESRSGGSRSSLGTLSEKGILVGGLLHHHGRLWNDV
jgi:hypothetical protein